MKPPEEQRSQVAGDMRSGTVLPPSDLSAVNALHPLLFYQRKGFLFLVTKTFQLIHLS